MGGFLFVLLVGVAGLGQEGGLHRFGRSDGIMVGEGLGPPACRSGEASHFAETLTHTMNFLLFTIPHTKCFAL